MTTIIQNSRSALAVAMLTVGLLASPGPTAFSQVPNAPSGQGANALQKPDAASPPLKYNVGIRKLGGGVVLINGTATFSLNAFNVGAATVGPGGVTVTDAVPSGLTILSVNGGPAWNCTTSGQNISCTYVGPAPVFATMSFPSITVQTKGNKTGPYQNCASIHLNGPATDTDLSNNEGCVPGVVNPGDTPLRNISIRKTGGGPVTIGNHVSFALVASNDGPGSILPAGAKVTDNLPAGLTYFSHSAPGWTCTPTVTSLTCTSIAAQPVGLFPAITLVATGKIVGPYNNCASIQPINAIEGSPINNQSCVSGVVNLKAEPPQ